ncbi:universal stress protein [Pradoshia sp.]
MAMFNHVLVAFDGSDSSKKALSLGMSFCKNKEDSILSIVHVYNKADDTQNYPVGAAPFASTAPLYVDQSQGQPMTVPEQDINTPYTADSRLVEIEEYVRGITDNGLINPHFVVLEGTIDDAILQYAEKEGANLIIVGNSSSSKLKNFFLGSISEKIIKNASCPVLVAR